jgi:hypothetical protein
MPCILIEATRNVQNMAHASATERFGAMPMAWAILIVLSMGLAIHVATLHATPMGMETSCVLSIFVVVSVEK